MLYARDAQAKGFKQVLHSTTPGGGIAGEALGEYVRSEKGGGWIGWALFRNSPNNPASAVRPADKRNTAFPLAK